MKFAVSRKKRPSKKKSTGSQWRVAPLGVRFTVKRGRQSARGQDGRPRTFRTRDAAARVARQLNLGLRSRTSSNGPD